MTIREIGQLFIDAIGGLLFILLAVLAFTYLPGLIWYALTEWVAGVL
jgi:hypothetical protein